MKKMTSRYKTFQFKFGLIIITAVLLVIAGLVVFVDSRKDRINDIYENRVSEQKSSFGNISELESQSLRSLTIENTYWDEMVSFIAQPDQKFIDEVLLAQLDSYNADFIWTYDKNYKLVSTTTIKSGPDFNLNLGLAPAAINGLFEEGFLKTFYRNSDAGVLEIFAATVHPTADVEHATTPQGYFMIARILDESYLDKLGEATENKVDLTTSQDQTMPEESNPETGIIAFDRELSDENNKPVGYLHAYYESNSIKSLSTSLDKSFIVAIIFIILLASGVYILLSRLIVGPLNIIYRALITENPSQLDTLKSTGNEFGQIALLVNQSILQKQEIAENAARIEKAQKALELRSSEIEKINKLMIDRELRMIELKAELDTIKSKK